MTGPTEVTDTYTSTDVCQTVGCSYRQLDYWVRVGWVTATAAQAQGSGTQRAFTARDVAMVTVVRHLQTLGPANGHTNRFMVAAREAPPGTWVALTPGGRVANVDLGELVDLLCANPQAATVVRIP